jgi:hypothetical protein
VTFDDLLALPAYALPQARKEAILLDHLNALTDRHAAACPAYARMVDLMHGRRHARNLADVPYLPVGVFKEHELTSVPAEEVFKTLTSSGTTGQRPSRIVLDRETARRQTAALASIMQHVLGPNRLPMLLIESRDVIANRREFSARGAGLVGMMSFGRRHVYALDSRMRLDRAAVEAFLAEFGRAPFLAFGFTYMVWAYFFEAIADLGWDLSRGILVHSGGWKTLEERAVDHETFRRRWREATGLSRIYNFYGLVEQVGGVFLEGEDGLLYPPTFGDVIIRDPETWKEAPVGTPGVIQVLSALPLSYPGHSLLTEDRGVVLGADDGQVGRLGKYFRVLGRVPRAELRGCSDTHAASVAAAR